MPTPFLGIVGGQKDLRDGYSVTGERLPVSMREPKLSPGKPELRTTHRNCSGRDEDDLLAAGAAAGDIVRQGVEPWAMNFTIFGGQERRPDLDNEPPRADQSLRRARKNRCLRSGRNVCHGVAAREPVFAPSRSFPASSAPLRAVVIAASTSSNASGTPARVAPDKGTTLASLPATRLSARRFDSTASGETASILLRPTISGFSIRP